MTDEEPKIVAMLAGRPITDEELAAFEGTLTIGSPVSFEMVLALARNLRAAREVLVLVEWNGGDSDTFGCPCCEADAHYEPDAADEKNVLMGTHAPGCRLAAVLGR